MPLPPKKIPSRRKWWTMWAVLVVCILVIGISAGGYYYYYYCHSAPEVTEETESEEAQEPCLTQNCLSASFEIMASMDPTQNPCQDFYQFTCGKFMNDAYKNNKPSPYLTQILRNVARLNAIISEEIRGDENDALLLQKRFYQACMNVTDIDDDANMQIKDLLEQIGGWPILKGQNWPETEITLMDLLLKCKNLGLPFQWLFEIKYFVGDLYVLNPKITKQYNESFKESAYQSLMVETAVNLGASRLRAFHEMQAVLDFEKQLEELVSKANKLFATNTNMDKLHNIFPNFSWSHFINNLTEDVNITMMENDTIIASEAYLLDLNLLLAATQKRVQINYVVWKIIQEFGVHMASPVRENFANFTNFMLPEKDQTNSRFKICIKDARARFPHVAELEFAALYSDEEKSRNVKEIIRNVKNQFISRLEAAYWIDEETKKLAVNKVEHIVEIVGYHKLDFDQEILEKFIGTTDLEFTSDNIIDMVREKNIYDFRQKFLVEDLPVLLDELSSVIFKQVFDISAAYSEHTNVIVFTAGTLQDTLYSEDRPKYLNYGALGSIIGHEIAHGFTKNAFAHDSEEEQLIIKGWFNESLHEISKLTFLNTTELWTNVTLDAFFLRTQCIIDDHEKYSGADGEETESENFADLIGIDIAYETYLKWVEENGEEAKLPGLPYTPTQLFWIQFGTANCFKKVDSTEWTVLENRHAPLKYRVINPLRNSVNFARDFECPLDSPMNPIYKCRVF